MRDPLPTPARLARANHGRRRQRQWRGTALLLACLGLAGVVGCPGPSLDELLAGKQCDDQGECADGYVCDPATNTCVPEGTPLGGSGGTAGAGGGGTGGVVGGGGSGGSGGCDQPTDCAGSDTTCQQRTCDAGTCGVTNAPLGTPCTEDGGEVCDGNGNCVLATCTDQVIDGDETDVDCGGPDCPACINGKDCLEARDCESGFCDTGAGGSGGGSAGAGGAGGAAGGGSAVVGTCTACMDELDCDDSPPEYCNGGVCEDKKALGVACTAPVECLSDNCPTDDLVCCNVACDGECEACVASKLPAGGSDGVCGLIEATDDPDTECSQQPPSTCGANGTGCSGTAARCNSWDSSTQCADPTCAAGVFTPALFCDGAGSCVPEQPINCEPYACNAAGDACLTDCVTGGQADCAPSYYCVDAVCCDSLCDGLCESCLAAQTPQTQDGTCDFITAWTDPIGECPGWPMCDGAGSCSLKPNGVPCTDKNECLSDECSDDAICCTNRCDGVCESCLAVYTPQTQDGTCDFLTAWTDPIDECSGWPVCNGAGSCSLKPDGIACSDPNECQSNGCCTVCDHCCNGSQDSGETDVDCGGTTTCPRCGDGLMCNDDADCQSDDCCGAWCSSGWYDRCLPASCSNGTQDGTETDTDCGGGTCRRCPFGADCNVDGDCRSWDCSGGQCD